MGERAKKIGEKLEGYGSNLFSNIGWKEILRDKEIKCSRSASHGKKTHGIDILFKVQNPYMKQIQGIVVECKNRQMESITCTEIEKWIKELAGTIQCAQSSSELNDYDAQLDGVIINSGLLLIHANNGFDKEKFVQALTSVKPPRMRAELNLFVAGNNYIYQWDALFRKISADYPQLSFLYPSIDGYNQKSLPHITINYLFSKYIFATRSDSRQAGSNTYTIKQVFMFIFDTVSTETFLYAWDMFKAYQLQSYDEYVFVFYPRNSDDIVYIKESFFDTLKNADCNFDADCQKKSKYDIIDNRMLSPVDTMR